MKSKLGRVALWLGLMLTLAPVASSQEDESTTLRQALRNAADDSVRYNLYFNIIQTYAMEGKVDSAQEMSTSVLQLDYTQADLNRLAKIYYTTAYAYDINGLLSQALHYYEEARKTYVEANNPMWIAGSINAKGTANFFAGKYGDAIRFFYESLRYAEENDLLLEQVESRINIASVYSVTGRRAEAIAQNQRAIQLQAQLGSNDRLGQLYCHIATDYLQLGQPDSALSYLAQARPLLENDPENPEFMGSLLTDQGSAYLAKGDTAEALANFEAGYIILNQFRADMPALLTNLTQQGEIALSQDQLDQALQPLHQALAFTDNSERHERRMDILDLLHQAYMKKGDPRTAYQYLNEYSQLVEQVRTQARDEVIAEMQAKYELHQQEQQLEIQNLTIRQQTKLRRILLVLAGALLLGVIGLLNFLRIKHKTNRQLADQKIIIESALEEKEALLKEIHHRVKNNLQVISSLLSLQSRSVTDEHAQAVLKEGQDRVRSMALIHQNLYQGEDLMTVNTSAYFEALTAKLVNSYSVRKYDKPRLSLNVQPLDLHIETMIPLALITNELVSNSLKHAFQSDQNGSGQIDIDLIEEDRSLVLRVKDNGQGISDLSDLRKNSFGFRVITAFAHKMKAEIRYLTESGFGVEMIVPNYKHHASAST